MLYTAAKTEYSMETNHLAISAAFMYGLDSLLPGFISFDFDMLTTENIRSSFSVTEKANKVSLNVLVICVLLKIKIYSRRLASHN